MEITVRLALPRDERSVPVVRLMLRNSLDSLGVLPEVVGDIEVALTEACTNVLDHADDRADYEVALVIDGDLCRIEVVDHGGGFDGQGRGLAEADPMAEAGRGIQLMRALVDRVQFDSPAAVGGRAGAGATAGTLVRLEKRLQWRPDSVLHALAEQAPGHP